MVQLKKRSGKLSHERKHMLYLSTHHYRAERCELVIKVSCLIDATSLECHLVKQHKKKKKEAEVHL